MTGFQNMEKWSLFFLLDQRKYTVRLFCFENMWKYFIFNVELKEVKTSHVCFCLLVYVLLFVVPPLKVWTFLKMVQASQLTTTLRSLLFAGILMRTSITTVTTLQTVRTLKDITIDYWTYVTDQTLNAKTRYRQKSSVLPYFLFFFYFFWSLCFSGLIP